MRINYSKFLGLVFVWVLIYLFFMQWLARACCRANESAVKYFYFKNFFRIGVLSETCVARAFVSYINQLIRKPKFVFDIILKNKRQFIVVVILFFILFHMFVNSSYQINFYIDLLPEIFGILITYELIDLILKKSEEKRIYPYRTLLFNKIEISIYRITYSIGRFAIPDTIDKKMDDILKEEKTKIEKILEDGINIFSEELIKELTLICKYLEIYFDNILLVAPSEINKYLLDILSESKKIVKLINKTELIEPIEESKDSLNYYLKTSRLE